jgi:hypothetical protein
MCAFMSSQNRDVPCEGKSLLFESGVEKPWSQGLQTDPACLAADLWKAHSYLIHPEVHPGLLDADNPADRQLWQENKEAD